MADLYTTQTLNSALAALEGKSRRRRQEASRQLAEIAFNNPALVEPYASQLIDALVLPEAQTRWQALDALYFLADKNVDLVAPAAESAEESLFDEDSSPCRLSAFRLIARIGKSTPERAAATWPLLDEAIQCYHGDVEYRDMLAALIDFAKGNLTPEVAQGLSDRVSFDAQNAQGYMASGSQEILDTLAARA